jgi:serine/threonine protein kinase
MKFSQGSIKSYVVDMELCGINLEDYIKEKFTIDSSVGIPISEVWNIMLQVSSGVSFLHTHRLIHCDLKPVNGIIPLYVRESNR